MSRRPGRGGGKQRPGSSTGGSAGGSGRGARELAQRVRTAKGRKLSSTLWLERQLNDPFVQAAQREGYRSRAAYKLIGIDDKRSEEHTSELQSRGHLVCRLLLEKKKI